MNPLVIVKTGANLKKFIETEALYQALEEIGGNELKAAKEVISDVGYAHRRREAINRALTHLESAHHHFYKVRLKYGSGQYAV